MGGGGAACGFAGRLGDELFKRIVDGQQLHAVTKWFYGGLPEEIASPRFNRTKQFSVKQLLLLEAVDSSARAFFKRVDALPLIDRSRLQAELRRWAERFAKAHGLIETCSPACQRFRWLMCEQRLPRCVALEIMSFDGGA